MSKTNTTPKTDTRKDLEIVVKVNYPATCRYLVSIDPALVGTIKAGQFIADPKMPNFKAIINKALAEHGAELTQDFSAPSFGDIIAVSIYRNREKELREELKGVRKFRKALKAKD